MLTLSDGGQPRVLIVDDDPGIVAALTGALAKDPPGSQTAPAKRPAGSRAAPAKDGS